MTKPKYVHEWVDRKTGIPYRKFRRAGYPMADLPAGIPYDSPEFLRAYIAACDLSPLETVPIGQIRSVPGSIAQLVAAYLERGLGDLAPGTQRQRRGICQRFRDQHGTKPVKLLDQKFFRRMVDEMRVANSPDVANNTLKALRHMFEFAVTHNYCETNFTLGVKCKMPASDGHETWEDEQIAQFEARHAIGTKARLAFALAKYTGQRRGDLISMGPQHINKDQDGNSIMTITQQKRTGGRATGVKVRILMHPELLAIIAATPCRHLTFLVTEAGKPFSGEHFTNWFADQRKAAGLPDGLVVHGLRKAFCANMASIGCDPFQIQAMSGHLSLKEIVRYTQAFNRERAGYAGMAKVIAADAAKASKNLPLIKNFPL